MFFPDVAASLVPAVEAASNAAPPWLKRTECDGSGVTIVRDLEVRVRCVSEQQCVVQTSRRGTRGEASVPRVNYSSLAISAGARQARQGPLVSHGRLDAGTSALLDTPGGVMDEGGANGLRYRLLFSSTWDRGNSSYTLMPEQTCSWAKCRWYTQSTGHSMSVSVQGPMHSITGYPVVRSASQSSSRGARTVSSARLRAGLMHSNTGHSVARSASQSSSRGARTVSSARLCAELLHSGTGQPIHR